MSIRILDTYQTEEEEKTTRKTSVLILSSEFILFFLSLYTFTIRYIIEANDIEIP